MAARLKNYNPENARLAFHRYIVSMEADNEWRAFCPNCEDPDKSNSPSASFNFIKDVWHCKGKCADGGKVSTLIPKMKSDSGFNYRSEIMKGRNAATQQEGGWYSPLAHLNGQRQQDALDRNIAAPTQDTVDKYIRKLDNSQAIKEKLKAERGFTDDTLKRFQIGWDGQRYTLPVLDAEGNIVNVRRYKLNASDSKDKMLNLPGFGTGRIYNIGALADDGPIVVTEGETDCILLNQHGISAVAHTSGAATWKAEWTPFFENKVVYICYDNDSTGHSGATKAASKLVNVAKEVYKIDIPLPGKGADITDFLHKEGHTADDFRELMANAQLITAMSSRVLEEAPLSGKKVSLEHSMNPQYMDEVIEMQVAVAGKQNPPYKVPKNFEVACSMSKGPICQECPLFYADGNMTVDIQVNDTDLFKFVDVNDKEHAAIMQKISGALCKDRARYEPKEFYYMEDLMVGNSVDAREVFEDQKPITRRVFSVDTFATDVNSIINVVGKNVANPKDGRLVFMAWDNKPVQTSLDTFELEDDIRKALMSFQPKNSKSDKFDPENPVHVDETPDVYGKCLEIAGEMSKVTQIYGRDLLHMAYDLVWHSPLQFEVEGKLIEKGWLEMMVVGDTRTGKSETAIQLGRHYGAGLVKSCEGATFAGLVGGVQQVGNAWMTTWGVIPLNDRRLVVLDEVSGLKDKDVIENMSSIRSSGRAQITKIDTQETSARTRLIWITNPADAMMIDERTGVGIDALRTIVKAPEDIARFDFVLAARASEVDSEVINQTYKKTAPRYTQEMCRNLVLWAWSLRPEQIKFTDQAVKRAQEISRDVVNHYVPDPPLIQSENFRFKLYRIACAMAARTFDIQWPEKDRMELRIYAYHIDAAWKFINDIYDSRGMEYRSASRRVIDSRERAKNHKAHCKDWLKTADKALATLRAVATDAKFKPQRDFQEFGGMMKDEAVATTAKLLQWGMLHRKSQGDAMMDKVLIGLLRELDEEGF